MGITEIISQSEASIAQWEAGTPQGVIRMQGPRWWGGQGVTTQSPEAI